MKSSSDACVGDQRGFAFRLQHNSFPGYFSQHTKEWANISDSVEGCSAVQERDFDIYSPVKVGSNCHHFWAEDPKKDVWEENNRPLTALTPPPATAPASADCRVCCLGNSTTLDPALGWEGVSCHYLLPSLAMPLRCAVFNSWCARLLRWPSPSISMHFSTLHSKCVCVCG